MQEVLDQLQAQLNGDINQESKVINYYSTDGSIYRIPPAAVLFPKDVGDVQKTMKTVWSLARQGNHLPVTTRGKGTDQAGGALGKGIVMVTPAHLYHLLQVSSKHVRVQPGVIYGDLQQILQMHGRYLPPYPSSVAYSTIGGAVANNACGEHSVKYGSTRDYVESLSVVLANGEQIVTKRLSKRELKHKKKQRNLEGQIYRQLDELLELNKDIIKRAAPDVTKNSAGYDLWDIKEKDGSFDLTPLIVGSQGTLGVVTEITLRTMPINPETTLIRVNFDNLTQAGAAAEALRSLRPSALELVDHHLLEFVQATNPGRIADFVGDKIPAIMFLLQFDDRQRWRRKAKVKKAIKLLKSFSQDYETVYDPISEQRLWRVRRSAAAVIWRNKTSAKALPIIEDAAVPVGKFVPFLQAAYKLFDTHKIKFAVWGHAGDANFHIQPFFDLAKPAERDKLFKIVNEFYDMVIAMGGTTAGEHNDGRLRAPFLPKLYGAEVYGLFKQVKQIFDPYNVLNPGVKIDVTMQDARKHVRREYSMPQLDGSNPLES